MLQHSFSFESVSLLPLSLIERKRKCVLSYCLPTKIRSLCNLHWHTWNLWLSAHTKNLDCFVYMCFVLTWLCNTFLSHLVKTITRYIIRIFLVLEQSLLSVQLLSVLPRLKTSIYRSKSFLWTHLFYGLLMLLCAAIYYFMTSWHCSYWY